MPVRPAVAWQGDGSFYEFGTEGPSARHEHPHRLPPREQETLGGEGNGRPPEAVCTYPEGSRALRVWETSKCSSPSCILR